MKRILKYKLPPPAGNGSLIREVPLPQHSEVMSAGVQGDEVMVWALVDSDVDAVRVRDFKVLGTGWGLADDELDGWIFLDTVFMEPFVWHVWVRSRD